MVRPILAGELPENHFSIAAYMERNTTVKWFPFRFCGKHISACQESEPADIRVSIVGNSDQITYQRVSLSFEGIHWRYASGMKI